MDKLEDIQTRCDIEHLVERFYKKARKDDLIGHFFTEVVNLNWQTHIPLICDFWETILLDRVAYRGNPMLKHLELHKRSRLESQHFERWLTLWEATVTEHFSGPKSRMAIERARQIAELMKYKVSQIAGSS